MKLPVYYCNINNFGDKLNENIFKLFFKCKIKSVPVSDALVMGIGSILDEILLDDKNKKIIKKPIHIFSTGFGFEEGGFFHNPNIILPERLMRNIKPWAVRGKLTLERIKKLANSAEGGVRNKIVLGDAGLLAHLLINKNKIEKKFNLGIVPHFADSDNKIWQKIQKLNPDSVILDIKKPPEEFLHDLCSCKTIISSAMHPLIACDALNIPNLWVRISEETTSYYKFMDYYSVYTTQTPVPVYILDNYEIINKDYIKKNYSINPDEVKIIQNNLIKQIHKMAGYCKIRLYFCYLEKIWHNFLNYLKSDKY